MSQKVRASVLRSFSAENSDPSAPRVLLLSLRAGGVGLNLTAANRCYMMDPWWSFAVEAQAIDRVHRMGQSKEVEVVRFVTKESIEGRMLRGTTTQDGCGRITRCWPKWWRGWRGREERRDVLKSLRCCLAENARMHTYDTHVWPYFTTGRKDGHCPIPAY